MGTADSIIKEQGLSFRNYISYQSSLTQFALHFATAQWSTWSDGSCNATCGGGIITRTRICPEQDACPGNSTNEEICNTQSCGNLNFSFSSNF